MYYDATRPSRLERLILAGGFSEEEMEEADKAVSLLLRHRLSKYNHSPCYARGWLGPGPERVLVVDQTRDDMSVSLGLASDRSFAEMLEAALDENPGCEIIVKTHPDVVAGRKRGYLDASQGSGRVRVIGSNVCPSSLLDEVSRVYVVSSQMGFEALLHQRPVACFGVPWYAGWGLTEDRHPDTGTVRSRRTVQRSRFELFAAAYLRYARYIRAETGQEGTIFDVIEFLERQRRFLDPEGEDSYCFGFSRWKRPNVRPFIQGPGKRIVYCRSADKARRRGISEKSRLIVWGHNEGPDVRGLSESLGLPIWRLEDGFIRSVGLGSDLIPPRSLVLDKRGIYYDPSEECDLERLLNLSDSWPEELRFRAARLRERIVAQRITKYNIDRPGPLKLQPRSGQTVILVPGQVENDASIRLGAGDIRTNEDLLRAVRAARPAGYIVYKPHPDVMVRNRPGGAAAGKLEGLCDRIEMEAGIISCLEACHEVHTITSLSGFDALLRGKTVITYGRPFYAGWGLTTDREEFPRRTRTLSLDELVAGVLILYPRYWDAQAAGYVECETVLDRLVDERTAILARYGKRAFRVGYLRRQMRKLGLLLKGNLWA